MNALVGVLSEACSKEICPILVCEASALKQLTNAMEQLGGTIVQPKKRKSPLNIGEAFERGYDVHGLTTRFEQKPGGEKQFHFTLPSCDIERDTGHDRKVLFKFAQRPGRVGSHTVRFSPHSCRISFRAKRSCVTEKRRKVEFGKRSRGRRKNRKRRHR
jgi:hypothetical protein